MCKKNCGCTIFWSVVSKHSLPGSDSMILLCFFFFLAYFWQCWSNQFMWFSSVCFSCVVRGNVPQPQNVTPLMQIYQQT